MLYIYTIGTNIYASQKGMAMGATRPITDKTIDKPSEDSQAILTLQTGRCLTHF